MEKELKTLEERISEINTASSENPNQKKLRVFLNYLSNMKMTDLMADYLPESKALCKGLAEPRCCPPARYRECAALSSRLEERDEAWALKKMYLPFAEEAALFHKTDASFLPEKHSERIRSYQSRESTARFVQMLDEIFYMRIDDFTESARALCMKQAAVQKDMNMLLASLRRYINDKDGAMPVGAYIYTIGKYLYEEMDQETFMAADTLLTFIPLYCTEVPNKAIRKAGNAK